jgi:hypothetical protein
MCKCAAPHHHRLVPALAALARGLALSLDAAAAAPALSSSGIRAFSDAMLSPDYVDAMTSLVQPTRR